MHTSKSQSYCSYQSGCHPVSRGSRYYLLNTRGCAASRLTPRYVLSPRLHGAFEFHSPSVRHSALQIGVWPPIPKASALVFTMRAAHSSPPCTARFFTAGFSPLFTRLKAVKKHLSLASEGACLGVGEAEDGSLNQSPRQLNRARRLSHEAAKPRVGVYKIDEPEERGRQMRGRLV